MKADVQLKETITSTNAIKKIPPILLVFALLSIALDKEEGRVISKAPSKEIPKTTNTINTNRLNQILELISYIVFWVNSKLINAPMATKMIMIDNA